MNIGNLLKIAYSSIMRNKTRTLLTILGVVIGISSVIAMVSLGQSSQKNINNQVSTMENSSMIKQSMAKGCFSFMPKVLVSKSHFNKAWMV